jgi:hypothetical protein
MSFYWTCPRCGANLDPGEHCDCQEQEVINQKHHRHLKQFIKNMEGISSEEHDSKREDYHSVVVY